MDLADNFPCPEWEALNTHALRPNDKSGRTAHYNGTLAGAQNAARTLSKKHGVGISIHTGGACVGYLNVNTRERLAPFDENTTAPN